MATLALIGLGSNLGDRRALLRSALEALGRSGPELILRASSSLHETPPVGGPGGQGAFLNAAAAVETTLDPASLLRRLQDIEREAGRVRTVRWGERTLDLDLLLFGDRRLRLTPDRDAIDLAVPHPRMCVRRFVLAPLAEIAADAVEPCTGRAVGELLSNLDRRPGLVALRPDLPGRSSLFSALIPRLSAIGLYYGEMPGPENPARASWLDRRFRELAASNWRAETWGDRWLVADAWYGRVAEDLGEAPPLLEPTFVVAPEGPGPPPPSDSPTLRVASGDVDALVDEVASACQAARAGRTP